MLFLIHELVIAMESYDDVLFQRLLDKSSELESLTKAENESTTRIRAIDTMVFDVLAWDKASVEGEKYCRDEGYADYVFSLNDRPCFVLEAKRSGIAFILPDREFQNRPYRFGILAEECPKAAKALNQAIGYAATLGARYVAVSNGHQWLFSLTFIHGQPLERRLIHVFESIDAISSRFSKFCSCFSKQGIEQNAVGRDLLDTLKIPAPPKLSSKIPGYPVAASRNVYQNELSYILDYVWQIMSQDEGTLAFVENCYVNPTSHNDILSLVRELIDKRKNEDDILRQYDIESIDKLPHEIAHLPAERPFVVLGEVGRGKSSFLKYLRFIAAKDHLDKYIQIELNFIDRPDTASEIPGFVYNEVERQLRENYSIDIHEDRFVRGVLHGDLQRLKKTPKGTLYFEDKRKYKEIELIEIENAVKDRHSYLTKVMHHLKKGRENSIALFFDNLDRRRAEIQEEAFLKASSIARDWASLVFICLRPDTYYRSHTGGVLDAIAPTAFTVGNPDLALVLKRRFAYARAIARGDSISIGLTRAVPSHNISLDLPKVARIFESCEFMAWKKHGIIPMLEAVSNGNIRRLLDFARSILCSGNLDTAKILTRIEESGHYYIPDFEGVKTLLYGDYMHYDPSKSPFINIFDIRHSEPSDHFLCLGILHYLVKIPHDGGSRGYVQVDEVLKYMTALGYSYTPSLDAVRNMKQKHYVREPVDTGSGLSENDSIRITSLGRYHIFSLVDIFQYLDATTIDTPVVDEGIREKIHDVQTIGEKLRRTEHFLDYLDNCSKSVQDQELQTTWRNISSAAKSNIAEIQTRNRDNKRAAGSDPGR